MNKKNNNKPKRNKNELSIEQKREIVLYHREHPNVKQMQLKQLFEDKFKTVIGRSTISDLLKIENQHKVLEAFENDYKYRYRVSDFPKLEECIYIWLCEQVSKGICVNDECLIRKSKDFGTMLVSEYTELKNFKYSHGWLQRFKQRFNITFKQKHGDSAHINIEELEKLQTKIKKTTGSFAATDIYNLDETALFYKLGPSQTLAATKTPGMKGMKMDKERITIALCVNATGKDKCKPILIGKYRRPRCFGKTFKPDCVVSYFYNSTAWMTVVILDQWLEAFNSRMKFENRNVLLVLDNAGGHSVQKEYSNVTLYFLPPNTTCALQPLDAGIIKSFKTHYKNKLLDHYLLSIEKEDKIVQPDLKQAMYYVREAWLKVSESTVLNCWRHCNIVDAIQGVGPLKDKEYNDNVEMIKQKAQRIDLNKFAFIPVDEFLTSDANQATGKSISDEDIVRMVVPEDEKETEQESSSTTIEEKKVTGSEVLEAYSLIFQYFEQNQFFGNDLNNMFEIKENIHRIIEMNKTQSKLTEFFL